MNFKTKPIVIPELKIEQEEKAPFKMWALIMQGQKKVNFTFNFGKKGKKKNG